MYYENCFTPQEGVKMNSELDFGSTEEIRNEFQFLMTTYETMFEEEFDFFYRIKSDGYIQLAYSYQKSKLEIKAQYKLQFDSKMKNVSFTLTKVYCIFYSYFPS